MKSVEQLVARQVAFYEAIRRLDQEYQRPGRGKVGTVTYGPYLVVSREKGSGAHTMGAIVAERLGWRVFDGEIVDQIAERTQVRRQLVESLDECSRPLASDMMAAALDRHHIGKVGYLHHLRQVILTLGQQGGVVILGRGARYILPRQFGLSVRMIAPFDVRVQRIAAGQGVSLEVARSEVKDSDKERTAFIHHYFGGKVDDPLYHDLMINSAHMTPESAANIVLTALHEKLGVTPGAHEQLLVK